jgi:hypothetical protein
MGCSHGCFGGTGQPPRDVGRQHALQTHLLLGKYCAPCRLAAMLSGGTWKLGPEGRFEASSAAASSAAFWSLTLCWRLARGFAGPAAAWAFSLSFLSALVACPNTSVALRRAHPYTLNNRGSRCRSQGVKLVRPKPLNPDCLGCRGAAVSASKGSWSYVQLGWGSGLRCGTR